MAMTRIFGHLLLRDPHFEFEGVMGPVPEESRGKLATTMEVYVLTLLEKLSYNDDEEFNEEPMHGPETDYLCLKGASGFTLIFME
ncbi:hypothetical protein D1007_11895 [Hordeum vulgare]|nr:hypothetical protein D1007_11895 [Hordeum vulgare]